MLQRAISIADAPSPIRYLWRVIVRYRKGQRNSELEQELERMAIELDAKDRQLESAPKASRSASA